MNKCQNTDCNKETKNPKYCSRSCSAVISNKKVVKHKAKIRTCTKCNSTFKRDKKHRRNTTCHKCWAEFLDTPNKTLKEYWDKKSIKNKHPSWKNSHIRALNRSWNKNLLRNGCCVCGYKTHVELAHIKPISSFSETAKLYEVNAPSNILPLCPNHHWEFDNNYLLIENILTKKEPALSD